MVALHLLAALEVGNGAGHFQNAVIGTGRELQPLHRHAEHVERLGIRLGIFAEHLFGHHGIAVDTLMFTEPLLLYLTRTDNALTDFLRGLARLHLAEL